MGRKIMALLGAAFVSGLVAACGFGGGGGERTAMRLRSQAAGLDLLQARKQFATKLTASSYRPDGPAETPPGRVFRKIHFKSKVGPLVAYLSKNPGDGKKHPAILWAHGGFGGIGSSTWARANHANDYSMQAFLQKGLVVMAPSWRGENDNPGRFELFYGEVDDLLAAARHLRSLPYVDKNRIYLAGHSTGGTLTLLATEATDMFRASFSMGGAPDLYPMMVFGGGYGNTPYDPKSRAESFYRSAINFVGAIKTPTFHIEGEKSERYVADAKRMRKAAALKYIPFHAYAIRGGDHFSILYHVKRVIAAKISKDTGPKCNITLSPDELKLP